MPPSKKNKAADADSTRLYHIGCDLQGPQQTYHLGGQALSYLTARIQKSTAGSNRLNSHGSVVMLRQDQVDYILDEARRHVVRRGRVIDAQAPSFRRMRGDYPVGAHCYCVPTTDTRAPLAGEDAPALPPRIVEDREEWTPPTPEMDPALAEEQRRAEMTATAMATAMAAAGLAPAKPE